MAVEPTSRHLHGATELTLLADLKQGLVPVRETISYASRLELLLQTLFELRRRNLEEQPIDGYVEPLERLETLHFVHWALLDGGRRLLLTVDFDGAWEPYLRLIADGAGPLLDCIFCHCEGYLGNSTDRDDLGHAARATDASPRAIGSGFERFWRWVREKQISTSFFYAADPSMTADDLRYLKQLEELQRSRTPGTAFDVEAAKLRVPRYAGAGQISLERALRVLSAMHRLTEYFPAEVDGQPNIDHEFLRRLTRELVKGFDVDSVPPFVRGVFAPQLAWIGGPTQVLSRKLAAPEPPRANVQGDILTPYPPQSHGCLLLMQLESVESGRDWLGRIVDRVSRDGSGDPVLLNVGITYAGLVRLGLTSEELDSLPREFRDGMEQRATWLGDVGTHHPVRWRRPRSNWPVDRPADGHEIPLGTVDVVVLLQTTPAGDAPHVLSRSHPLYATIEELEALGGASVLAVETLQRSRETSGSESEIVTREHFGFRDGLSQPSWDSEGAARDRVPLGELLLGHPNARGDDPATTPELLQDGTFLVIRKMPQDVGAFRRFVRDQAGLREDGSERPDGPGHAPALRPAELAARLMGRHQDGDPLLLKPLPSDDNDFGFEDDPDGLICPVHSHVRRANPRTDPPVLTTEATRETPIPRIFRRGFTYGPPYDEAPDEPRGLFFMAYNASIGEQYEVIQSWINGGNRTGVLSEHRDPLMGPHPVSTQPEPRTFRFLYRDERDQSPRVGRVSLEPTPFVGLDWGMYLFVPSLAVLRRLGRASDAPRTSEAAAGDAILGVLTRLAVTQPDEAALEWKKLLEDRLRRPEATQVWTAIRERHGGVLDTPYGVLVGSAEAAMAVFRDARTYSVREYGERMRRSLGLHYLGMDPAPKPMTDPCDEEARTADERVRREVPSGRKQRESELPNALIEAIDEATAFEAAHRRATAWLAQLPDYGTGTARIGVQLLYEDVFGALAHDWFDLPDGTFMKAGVCRAESERNAPRCPKDFEATARYIFSPNPTPFVVREGQDRGRALLNAALDYVAETRHDESHAKGSFYATLCATGKTNEEIATTLVGTVHGFVGPVGGTFLSVAHQWIESGDLWRHQQRLSRAISAPGDAALHARARAALMRSIIRSMQSAPFPYVLHRTTVTRARLGPVEIAPGRRVVLGLVSATQDQPGSTEVLLGGLDQSAGGTAHACPGGTLAFGVLLGLLTALLQLHDLRRDTALLLSWHRRSVPA